MGKIVYSSQFLTFDSVLLLHTKNARKRKFLFQTQGFRLIQPNKYVYPEWKQFNNNIFEIWTGFVAHIIIIIINMAANILVENMIHQPSALLGL